MAAPVTSLAQQPLAQNGFAATPAQAAQQPLAQNGFAASPAQAALQPTLGQTLTSGAQRSLTTTTTTRDLAPAAGAPATTQRTTTTTTPATTVTTTAPGARSWYSGFGRAGPKGLGRGEVLPGWATVTLIVVRVGRMRAARSPLTPPAPAPRPPQVSIIVPPLAVAIKTGDPCETLINILWWALGWFPGVRLSRPVAAPKSRQRGASAPSLTAPRPALRSIPQSPPPFPAR
jgi:hypothetical protein